MGSEAEAKAAQADAKLFKTPAQVMRNFLIMAFCFSANHGTVTALIAIASSAIGLKLSALSFVTLYTCYTLSALLLANVVLSQLGSKWTIIFGLTVYCIYNASFMVVNYTSDNPHFQTIFVAVGGVIGGIGAGTLWTAQGAFFASSASSYAIMTGMDAGQARAKFAGYFAAIMLSWEFLCKVLLSALQYLPKNPNQTPVEQEKSKNNTLFIVFTIIAIVSALGMISVLPVAVHKKKKLNGQLFVSKFSAAMNLMVTDPRVLLMLPYNFTFGMAAPFLNQYVNLRVTTQVLGPVSCTNPNITFNPHPKPGMDDTCTQHTFMDNETNKTFWFAKSCQNASDHFGPIPHEATEGNCSHSSLYVGWMVAIITASAVVASLSFGRLNSSGILPKQVPMIFASLCFGTIAFVFFFIRDPNNLGSFGYLVPMYLAFGIGRGVWESTTKAVFADFFSGPNAGAGFAHIVIQNGAAGAIGAKLFSNENISQEWKAGILLFFAGTGIVFYLIATRMKGTSVADGGGNIQTGADSDDEPLLDEKE